MICLNSINVKLLVLLGHVVGDHDPLPSGSEFTFRRLSFDKNLERQVCIHDYQAHLLLLAETVYMIHYYAYPPSIRSKYSKLASFNANDYLGSLPHSNFSQYSHYLLQKDSFLDKYRWKFYYRVSNMVQLTLQSRCNVKIVQANYGIVGDAFCVMDAIGNNSDQIPLSSVHCIKVQRHIEPGSPGRILIETTFPNMKKRVLNCTVFWTLNPNFFYSIARYVITQQKIKSSDKFVNSTFRGLDEYPTSPDVKVTINPGFIL